MRRLPTASPSQTVAGDPWPQPETASEGLALAIGQAKLGPVLVQVMQRAIKRVHDQLPVRTPCLLPVLITDHAVRTHEINLGHLTAWFRINTHRGVDLLR